MSKKARKFRYEEGPHAPQLCIQAHDLTLAECELLRGIISNNWIDSDAYKACKPAAPFIQGYEKPHGVDDGWVLIEFWTQDEALIQTCVDYINKCFAEM